MPSQERPPVTPERLMQFAFGFAPPLILEAALRHRLFDALAGGPRSLDDLAAATKTSPRGLRAVADALVGLEFLARDAQGRYALTPESDTFLVSTRPSFRGGFFLRTTTQLIPNWMQLAEVMRTGKPATAVNQEGEGAKFFQDFVEDLFPFNYAAAQALADALGVAKAAASVSVLDVAAGSGVWSVALAQKSPQVRVTAVDWPDVLKVTRRVAARHGLEARYKFVEGDLHRADFGTGHQVATLGHILHSEGEEGSRALLKKTFAALAPGGTVAIAEWLVTEDRTGPPPGLIFGVNMLVNTDRGDVFTFEEIRRWLHEAGFTNARTVEVPAVSPLVLADRPAR